MNQPVRGAFIGDAHSAGPDERLGNKHGATVAVELNINLVGAGVALGFGSAEGSFLTLIGGYHSASISESRIRRESYPQARELAGGVTQRAVDGPDRRGQSSVTVVDHCESVRLAAAYHCDHALPPFISSYPAIARPTSKSVIPASTSRPAIAHHGVRLGLRGGRDRDRFRGDMVAGYRCCVSLKFPAGIKIQCFRIMPNSVSISFGRVNSTSEQKH